MANHVVSIGVADLKGAFAEIVGNPTIGATLVDIGTIAFSDVDVSDVHSVTVTGFNSGSSNVAVPAGSLLASLTSDTTNGTGGLVSWTYSIDAAAIEYLATDEAHRGLQYRH